jgi:hypothetical protein
MPAPKEPAYDELIAPLMQQIISIGKEHHIPLVALAEAEALRTLMAAMHPILDKGAEPTGDELVDRLRGIYVIPVNDGAGPLDGKTTFTRYFATGDLCKRAANEIMALRDAAKQTVDCRFCGYTDDKVMFAHAHGELFSKPNGTRADFGLACPHCGKSQ